MNIKGRSKQEEIIIRNCTLPVIRAGMSNFLLPISFLYVFIINKILLKILWPDFLRYPILVFGAILILKNYLLDVSRIVTYKSCIKIYCTIKTVSVNYDQIQYVKLKKYPIWGMSILVIKRKDKLIKRKFYIGPSFSNYPVYTNSLERLKELFLDRNIILR